MTCEDRKRITRKGRRWLIKYLTDITEGALSEESKRELITAMCSIYSREMKSNEEFSAAVLLFCSEARTADEKSEFFERMMKGFIRNRSNKMMHIEK